MAFSQVEIMSPQNFGCILRDRNQRHESVVGKMLKSPAKDHHYHHQLLNRASGESVPSDENCRNRIDSWIENQQKQNRSNRLRSPGFLRNRKDNNNNCSDNTKQTSRVLVADNNRPKDPVNLPPPPSRENISRKDKTGNSNRNTNLGASSLVQIWEARLNGSNGGNTASQGQSMVTNSGATVLEISSSGPSVSGDSDSSADEGEDSSNNNAKATENELKNPDRTVEIESGSSSSGGSGSVSDSGESKGVRVADIIQRLSNEQKQASGENNKGGVNGLPIIRTPRPSCNSPRSPLVSDRMSKKSSFPWVTCSAAARLRGRQAFSDLLMQLERDRHRELEALLERNAVSKFSHRGRLQSMLRLRSLQRCQAIQDRHRSNANAKTAETYRPGTGSAVMLLRERFRANAGNGAAIEQRKGPAREIDSKSAETQSLSVSTRTEEESILLQTLVNRRLSPQKVEEATLRKDEDVVKGATETKVSCLHVQETTENEVSMAKSKNEDEAITKISSKERESRDDSRENDQRNSLQDPLQDDPKAMSPVYKGDQQNEYLDRQETAYLNNWEEQEIEEQLEYQDQQFYYDETYYDWFSEISRPRSYWEDLRKHRYMEVLNTAGSGKEEICRLLERRTVSDFLESGLREKIDRVMICRVQNQPNWHVQERTNKWELPEDEEEEEDAEKDEGKREEEEERGEHEEQDQDDDSIQLSSQIFSPSPGRSWSSRDPETASTPPLTVKNHPSAEMEIIKDLRAQIEQLQQEMSELRNSVKSCMDMNSHLQQSVHRDNPLKRKCCVCNETQVQSLLYRCGHMCTCLKCAHELQWNRGKCPICRAQILDVVRVFVDPRN